MFFNISNHPCNVEKTTWSKEQVEQANALGGEVVDIPFPKVTPDMTDEQIAGIAKEYARDIYGMAVAAQETNKAAMVAGEYVTTIRLIAELQKKGIPCYFGQSERVAEEREEDGQIVVIHKFVFKGFRKAPNITID